MASGKRGRPRTERPFFTDPESERLRVDQCFKEGRDPYPPYKHEPCAAELELKKDVMPGVPFDLVLQLNDSDCDGFPLFNAKAEAMWDKAQAERQQAARSGGAARSKINLAAEIIAAEADYISAKKGEGWNRSRIINGIKVRRTSKGQQCASRTEMYDQIRTSGLWD
jgi:hypothetical protein